MASQSESEEDFRVACEALLEDMRRTALETGDTHSQFDLQYDENLNFVHISWTDVDDPPLRNTIDWWRIWKGSLDVVRLGLEGQGVANLVAGWAGLLEWIRSRAISRRERRERLGHHRPLRQL